MADYPVILEWMPFELHPDAPPEGEPRSREDEDPHARHVREYVERMAAEMDLALNMPQFLTNTRQALEVTEYAKQIGRANPLVRAFFEAYYVDNLNLGQADVVEDTAVRAGLDREEVHSVIANRRCSSQLDREIAEAERTGIDTTPSAMVCTKLLRGSKPREIFEEAVNECVRHQC